MEKLNYSLQESIQSHVNGESDDVSRRALLEQAKTQPEIADELSFSQSLAKALHHPDVLAASAVIRSVIAEEGFPPPPAPTDLLKHFEKGKWWVWAGASVFIIMLFAGGYFWAESQDYFVSNSQKLSRANVQPLENVFFLPGEAQTLTDLNAGMAAYDAQQYAEAVRSLNAYLKQRPDHAAQLYLGVAYLLSGKAEKAVQPLKEASKSEEPPIREASLWYLALAHLENEDATSARDILKKIPANGIYGLQAQELLEKMDES